MSKTRGSASESASGRLDLTKMSLKNPTGEEEDVGTAFMFLYGDAARLLYNLMSEADARPAASDLETRSPAWFTFNDVARRIGTHVTCFHMPQTRIKAGQPVFVKNPHGQIKYSYECNFHGLDYKKGELQPK